MSYNLKAKMKEWFSKLKKDFDKEYIIYLNQELIEKNNDLIKEKLHLIEKNNMSLDEIAYLHKHWTPRGTSCHLCDITYNKLKTK